MSQSWPITRELLLAIVMGMRTGFKMVRGLRKQLDEREQFLIAEKVAEQIRRSNYNVEEGEPLKAHSASHHMPARLPERNE